MTVSDTLPGGFAYQDSLPADGTYNNVTGLWTVGSLAKDAATTLVITATVNASGSYTNYVEVANAGERDVDSTPANGSTTEDDDDTFVVTPVPVADLHLEKIGAPRTPAGWPECGLHADAYERRAEPRQRSDRD